MKEKLEKKIEAKITWREENILFIFMHFWKKITWTPNSIFITSEDLQKSPKSRQFLGKYILSPTAQRSV